MTNAAVLFETKPNLELKIRVYDANDELKGIEYLFNLSNLTSN